MTVDNHLENIVSAYITSTYGVGGSVSARASRGVAASLKKYQSLIKYWTYKRNLVSPGDVDNLWIKHFLPSFKPLELGLIPDNSEVLDAGSGAGFPGVPIKILKKDIRLTLCDSNRKRTLFLKEVVEQLEMKDTLVVNNRIELLEKQYDVVVSRAMGKPEEIYKRLIALTRPGGRVLIWTSKSAEEKLGCIEVESYDIPEAGKLLFLKNNDIV